MLAIAGIIGSAGVGGYTVAMKKHRANELIHEAAGRALAVSQQLAVGRKLDELDFGGYPNNDTGHGKFSDKPIPLAGGEFFKIPITGMDEAGCEQLKVMAGGSLRRVDCKDEGNGKVTADLIYQKDLSPSVGTIPGDTDGISGNSSTSGTGNSVTRSYDNNRSGCEGAGYQYCSNNICITKEETCPEEEAQEEAHCDEYSSAELWLQNVTINGVTYSGGCAGTASDGTTQCCCPAGKVWDATNGCQAATEGATCTTQDDCGGRNSEYYCKVTSADYTESCSTNGKSKTAHYFPDSITGTCQNVSKISYTEATVIGLGAVRLSNKWIGWWSADNWCQAQGKSLINIEDFQVYHSGTNTLVVEGSKIDEYLSPNNNTMGINGCARGKTCGPWDESPYNQMWDGNKLTEKEDENGERYQDKYSEVMKDLKVKFKLNNWIGIWTKSSYGNTNKYSCFVLTVNPFHDGSVGYNWRSLSGYMSSSWYFVALCK